MTESFNHLGIADKKKLYVVRARTKTILTRKPMGIAAWGHLKKRLCTGIGGYESTFQKTIEW